MAYPVEERARLAASLRNLLHSVALVGGISLIMAACAWLLFGQSGVIWAFVLIGVLILVSPRITPDLIIRMYGARPVDPRQGGELLRVIGELAQRAGLPAMPQVYIIPSPIINAFATGHKSAPLLAVTQGMLSTLTPREITGVLGHEMAHVRNGDLWVMSLADTMSRFTYFMSMTGVILFFVSLPAAMFGLAPFPLFTIIALYFAPTLSGLLQLGLSRTREYEADLEGARLSGDPEGLASALHKIEARQGSILERVFLPGFRVPVPSILRTHPATEERIRRLLALRDVQRPAMQPHNMEPAAGLFATTRARPSHHLTGLWY